MTARPVVIGVGNPMRGDDGVGAAAVDGVRQRVALDAPGPDLVVLDGEPTRLIDAWRDREQVIVIDAARSGAPPGTIHRIELGSTIDPDHPANGPMPGSTRSASSHGAGVAEAIALAGALDALPTRLVLLAVEAADVAMGAGLSPAVSAVVPELVERVLAEVAS